MALPIYSITPFTLLDYPDKTACIFWFAGCNMRCLYCYNPDIVTGKGKLSYDDALKFLDRRGKLLDGVVLSGGECTLHQRLPGFISQLKKRGYKVKIDTNGSTPVVMRNLIAQDLIDYVALDFKALPQSFKAITVSNLFGNFEETLSLLLKHNMKFEVRTTVHSSLITKNELAKMVNYLEVIGYKGKYYVQNFVNDTPTLSALSPSLKNLEAEDFYSSTIQVIFRG